MHNKQSNIHTFVGLGAYCVLEGKRSWRKCIWSILFKVETTYVAYLNDAFLIYIYTEGRIYKYINVFKHMSYFITQVNFFKIKLVITDRYCESFSEYYIDESCFSNGILSPA